MPKPFSLLMKADLVYLYYVRVMQKLHRADLPLDLMSKCHSISFKAFPSVIQSLLKHFLVYNG